jgi:hypothetical protein
MSTLLESAEMNGIDVVCVNNTYPAGTSVEGILDGSAVPESETWTSDGRMVNRARWCECGADGETDLVYFHDPISGAHGWACPKCREVVQYG